MPEDVRHTDTPEPTDDEAVLRAVERFALLFSEAGMQRMTARVFAFALIDDADRYTAGELSRSLRVSPAAISQAVRDLVNAGLLGKEREPGSRSDQYRVYDEDVWQAILLQRSPMLRRQAEIVDEIMTLLPPRSRGWRRLHETREFLLFMAEETAEVARRWHEHRAKILGDDSASPATN